MAFIEPGGGGSVTGCVPEQIRKNSLAGEGGNREKAGLLRGLKVSVEEKKSSGQPGFSGNASEILKPGKYKLFQNIQDSYIADGYLKLARAPEKDSKGVDCSVLHSRKVGLLRKLEFESTIKDQHDTLNSATDNKINSNIKQPLISVKQKSENSSSAEVPPKSELVTAQTTVLPATSVKAEEEVLVSDSSPKSDTATIQTLDKMNLEETMQAAHKNRSAAEISDAVKSIEERIFAADDGYLVKLEAASSIMYLEQILKDARVIKSEIRLSFSQMLECDAKSLVERLNTIDIVANGIINQFTIDDVVRVDLIEITKKIESIEKQLRKENKILVNEIKSSSDSVIIKNARIFRSKNLSRLKEMIDEIAEYKASTSRFTKEIERLEGRIAGVAEVVEQLTRDVLAPRGLSQKLSPTGSEENNMKRSIAEGLPSPEIGRILIKRALAEVASTSLEEAADEAGADTSQKPNLKTVQTLDDSLEQESRLTEQKFNIPHSKLPKGVAVSAYCEYILNQKDKISEVMRRADIELTNLTIEVDKEYEYLEENIEILLEEEVEKLKLQIQIHEAQIKFHYMGRESLGDVESYLEMIDLNNEAGSMEGLEKLPDANLADFTLSVINYCRQLGVELDEQVKVNLAQ